MCGTCATTSVFEARLVNREIGSYKGYPLDNDEWPMGIESSICRRLRIRNRLGGRGRDQGYRTCPRLGRRCMITCRRLRRYPCARRSCENRSRLRVCPDLSIRRVVGHQLVVSDTRIRKSHEGRMTLSSIADIRSAPTGKVMRFPSLEAVSSGSLDTPRLETGSDLHGPGLSSWTKATCGWIATSFASVVPTSSIR